MTSNFDIDYKFGNKFEKETKTILGGTDNFVIMEGEFKAYDIIDKNTGIKYEVKSDRYTLSTKNLAIEFEYKKRGSGITTTESDFYYYYPTDYYENYYYYYIIPTSAIKDIIKKKPWKEILVKNNTKCYLIPEREFSKYLIQRYNEECFV